MATVDSVTISPNLYAINSDLKFEEGDILGIYLPNERDSRAFLYEQDTSGPLNLRIPGMVNAPATTITEPLQTEGNNDFPLVTVELGLSPLF